MVQELSAMQTKLALLEAKEVTARLTAELKAQRLFSDHKKTLEDAIEFHAVAPLDTLPWQPFV
jgi:hypothetical protein